MMDKAPQHQSSTFQELRQRFERDNNCLLLSGEANDSLHIAVPAGGNENVRCCSLSSEVENIFKQCHLECKYIVYRYIFVCSCSEQLPDRICFYSDCM